MKRIGIILILFGFLFLFSACNLESTNKVHYQKTESIMDTFVTITVVDQNQEHAEYAIDEAFTEFKRIESLFSIYNNSPVFDLNNHGKLMNASPEILYLIRRSLYYHSLTNGSFEITVQPILDLYKNSFSINSRPPTNEEIELELLKVGSNNIILNNSDIILMNNTKVTFGGIAKGYAIDRASEILSINNISSALVNAGGDVYSYGKRADGNPWVVALSNPENNDEYITLIRPENQGVATSGNYERYFNENHSFHHIVDPKTGYSANKCISVTVIAPTAIIADTLATAVFVMGPKKGLELIERLEGIEALIIDYNKTIIYSTGFKIN